MKALYIYIYIYVFVHENTYYRIMSIYIFAFLLPLIDI